MNIIPGRAQSTKITAAFRKRVMPRLGGESRPGRSVQQEAFRRARVVLKPR